MFWHINRRNSLFVQLNFLDKGRAIQGLVVCWMLLNLIYKVFDYHYLRMILWILYNRRIIPPLRCKEYSDKFFLRL